MADFFRVLYVGALQCHVPPEEEELVIAALERFRCQPIFLSPELRRDFYNGYCQSTLHGVSQYCGCVRRVSDALVACGPAVCSVERVPHCQ